MIDVERSFPPPVSLARQTSWAGADVLERLHEDFMAKCYLCEAPLAPADFEVDHRVPRTVNEDLHYEWTNLFPACDYCNGRRPAYPSGGLLDPGQGVEARLVQSAAPIPAGIQLACEFSPRNPGDILASNCADELAHLHSPERATTYRARKRARNLLRAVYEYWLDQVWPDLRVVDELRERHVRGETVSTSDLAAAEGRLRTRLSRRSPFTMLARSLSLLMVRSDIGDLFD